jgi:hypothetical protein
MSTDRNRGLEVGESSSFGDFLKQKLRPADNSKMKNAKDINDFVDKNSVS